MPRGNYKRAGEGLSIRAYDSSLFDPYESECKVNFYRKLAIITRQNVGNLRPFWGDLQKDTDTHKTLSFLWKQIFFLRNVDCHLVGYNFLISF